MSSDALAALIRSFRRLIKVEIRNTVLKLLQRHIPATQGHPSQLNHPYFFLSHPEPLLQVLCIEQDDDSFDFDTLKNWLLPGHVASSLKALFFGRSLKATPFTRFISDLGSCPSLEYIECNVYEIDKFSGLDLSKLSNLRTLCFALGAVVAPLDNLLSSETFQGLESLELVHRCYHQPQILRKTGLEVLPRLSERGTLKFRYNEFPMRDFSGRAGS
ncbi:unnamed protein product [Somion occarium]|uniref:Uncharacterized protein n=1 Tax=Somion occarium TaxID=3059160 RepID=A0ABP1DNH2_9APHY